MRINFKKTMLIVLLLGLVILLRVERVESVSEESGIEEMCGLEEGSIVRKRINVQEQVMWSERIWLSGKKAPYRNVNRYYRLGKKVRQRVRALLSRKVERVEKEVIERVGLNVEHTEVEPGKVLRWG